MPLALLGLALTTASISVVRFSTSFSSSKLTLPIGTCAMAVLSTRYSTLPPFTSSTAFATSAVTVPDFGLGIRPLGPRIRPMRPTTPIMSGVAMATSKSNQFSFLILSASSASPTYSAPAARASSAFSPLAKTRTRTFLPVPWGRTTVPRTCWSAWRGSTPRRMDSSTVSSNLALPVCLTSAMASAGL